jgi:hypothetical protein
LPTFGIHAGNELAGHVAAVEAVESVVRQPLQGAR